MEQSIRTNKVKARHARDVFYPKACGMTFNVALDAGVVKRGPGKLSVRGLGGLTLMGR